MINLESSSLRDLQKECAKAISVFNSDNNALSKFNKIANHNSQKWYIAVIEEYIKLYGDLPSKTGPAKNIKLLLD